MHSKTNELKKTVFYEMLNLAGRVFILVRYSENVMIGNRGFTENEAKNGIILVFNTSMNFSWEDSGISASLIFGTTLQKCFIPAEDIMMIYSPELNSQFITSQPLPDEKETDGETKDQETAENEKVVRVDFSKKKHQRTTP